MHQLEISIFSLYNGLVRLAKIMNNLVKNLKILRFKVIFQCLKLVDYLLTMCLIFSALFIILVSPTMTLFSEKVLISNRCISGVMSNLIKKSWTDSNVQAMLPDNRLYPQQTSDGLWYQNINCLLLIFNFLNLYFCFYSPSFNSFLLLVKYFKLKKPGIQWFLKPFFLNLNYLIQVILEKLTYSRLSPIIRTLDSHSLL